LARKSSGDISLDLSVYMRYSTSYADQGLKMQNTFAFAIANYNLYIISIAVNKATHILPFSLNDSEKIENANYIDVVYAICQSPSPCIERIKAICNKSLYI
jgi:hypothetical protein